MEAAVVVWWQVWPRLSRRIPPSLVPCMSRHRQQAALVWGAVLTHTV